MDYMRSLPDKCYDLAICDPPYGIGVNNMNMGSRKTIKPDKKKWDDTIPKDEYFQELFRVSKYQIIWGGNYFHLPPSKSFVIWDKAESMYGRDFAECEFAWVTPDKPAKIFKKTPNQLDRIHPTQKPVALYKWLLKNYAQPGDKILDSHGGSMSSVIAALDMGFEITCIEKDKDYYEDAKKRIQQWQRQQNLFSEPARIEFIYSDQE